MIINKKYGILGTIFIHVVLIVLLILLGFSTPLPLPAEEGILINFGDTPTGSGYTEPSRTPVTEQPRPQPVEQSQTSKSQTLTQDYEDAPVIEEKTAKTPTKTPNEIKEEDTKKTEEVAIEPARQVNKRALYTGKKDDINTSTSEGQTGNTGNQGSQSGSPDSNNRSAGESSGGNGISFSLSGRNPQFLDKPAFNYQEEGKVVVEITVDREGKVTNAIPGVKGSTTQNIHLLNEAKKAALNSTFNKKSDAAAFQKGTITYIFSLR